jgi:hypothetical protein
MPKTLATEHGPVRIKTPRDRKGTFEPQLVRKGQRRFEGFDDKILALCARGLSTRDIEAHLAKIYAVKVIGTRAACRALGASPATIYRRRRPPAAPSPALPRPRSPRALSDAERAAVLAQLHSERFVDSSRAQVWATLLDEGTYLASERTMYRLLAADGEVRERRAQLTHTAYTKPELLAERPNELWSWDISKLNE